MNIHNTSSSRRNFLLGAVAATLAPQIAMAQSPVWPTRAVKIVIATGPGSGTDTAARLLAPRLEKIWKQPVIVENKAGAGSIIGTEYVLAANDGHTLLLASPSTLLAKYTTLNLRFDPLKDLVPVYRVFNAPVLFVTNLNVAQRAKSLAELVTLSKSLPEGIFFSGAGPASFFNLAMAVVSKPIGIRYSAIDHSGVSPLLLSLLRNDTQLAISGPPSVKGQIDSGELRALAVIDSKRLAALPDVPTLNEAVGYNGFLPISWGGIMMPKNTSKEVIDIVARAFGTLYAEEPERKSLEDRILGTMVQSSPEQFAKEYAEEAETWKKTVAMMGIAPQ